MIKTATVPLRGVRTNALVVPISLRGMDLTGAVLSAVVLQDWDNDPASPEITPTVTLDSVEDDDGTPVSHLTMTIAKADMESVPAPAEVGEDVEWVWYFDIQTDAGDENTQARYFEGKFLVGGSAGGVGSLGAIPATLVQQSIVVDMSGVVAGATGPAGPAGPTYLTLATFKAAPISNERQSLNASGIAPGDFFWTPGDYTGLADDINIIKADSTALSVGAWVRQQADQVALNKTSVADAVRPNMLTFGSPTGASNVVTAFNAAKAGGDVVRFTAVSDEATTYTFSTANAGMFTGVSLDVDPLTTISIPGLDGSPPLYGTMAAMSFAKPTSVTLRDVGITTMFPADPEPHVIPQRPPMEFARHRTQRLIDMTAAAKQVFLRRPNQWPPTNDTWTDVAATASSTSSVSFTGLGGNFAVGFVQIAVGETVEMGMADIPTSGAVGIFVRGTNGYAGAYASVVAGIDDPAHQIAKTLGGPFQDLTNLPYPNKGVNGVFRFERSRWSITRISANQVVIRPNGESFLRQPISMGNVGDIQEVGLGYYAIDANTYHFDTYTLDKSNQVSGGINLKGGILFGGDSTVEDMGACTWPSRVPELLEGSHGLQVGPLWNVGGVGGDSAGIFAATLAFLPSTTASVVGICAGTNDIQGLTNRAVFTTTWTDGLDDLLAAGVIPIVMIPYIWYSYAAGGNTGFVTQNDDAGAWYRGEIKRVCLEKGVRYVDICEELGNPQPSLRNDPRGGYQLRDNIHQTPGKGHALYAQAFANAVLELFGSIPPGYTSELIVDVLGAGVTSPSTFGYQQDFGGHTSLWGDLAVTTIADGTLLMTIPRHLRADRTVRVFLPAFASGSMIGMCRGDIIDGELLIYDVPATTDLINLEPASWRAD